MKERGILFSSAMVQAILRGDKTQTRRIIGLDSLRPSETPGYDWTWRGRAPIRSIAQQRRHPGGCWQDVGTDQLLRLCPYGGPGEPGDRLWVRETWYCDHYESLGKGIHLADEPGRKRDEFLRKLEYRASHHCRDWEAGCPCLDDSGRSSWRPSIFMPRWASRITLEIVSMRVERLQEISEEDAAAEGVQCPRCAGRGIDPVRIEHDPDWCAICGGASQGVAPREDFAILWDSINGKRKGAAWSDNPFVWRIEFRRLP